MCAVSWRKAREDGDSPDSGRRVNAYHVPVCCMEEVGTGVPGLEFILHCMHVRSVIISRAALSNMVLSLDVMCFSSRCFDFSVTPNILNYPEQKL